MTDERYGGKVSHNDGQYGAFLTVFLLRRRSCVLIIKM